MRTQSRSLHVAFAPTSNVFRQLNDCIVYNIPSSVGGCAWNFPRDHFLIIASAIGGLADVTMASTVALTGHKQLSIVGQVKPAEKRILDGLSKADLLAVRAACRAFREAVGEASLQHLNFMFPFGLGRQSNNGMSKQLAMWRRVFAGCRAEVGVTGYRISENGFFDFDAPLEFTDDDMKLLHNSATVKLQHARTVTRAGIAKLASVQQLDLIGDSGVIGSCSLATMTQLRSLRLCSCSSVFASAQLCCELGATLEEVNLSHIKSPQLPLGRMIQLRKLHLTCCSTVRSVEAASVDDQSDSQSRAVVEASTSYIGGLLGGECCNVIDLKVECCSGNTADVLRRCSRAHM